MQSIAERKEEAIKAVLEEYSITYGELFGKKRIAEYVKARKALARRLADIGFIPRQTAKLLSLDRSTIAYYLKK